VGLDHGTERFLGIAQEAVGEVALILVVCVELLKNLGRGAGDEADLALIVCS